jgi:DNA-binding transcriptional MerR regulator
MNEKEELELLKFCKEKGITLNKLQEILDAYPQLIQQVNAMSEVIEEMKGKRETKEILSLQADDLKEMVALGKSIEELKKLYPQEDTLKTVMAYRMLKEDSRKDDATIQVLMQKIDSLEKSISEQKKEAFEERVLSEIRSLNNRLNAIQSQPARTAPLQELKEIVESYKTLKEGIKELGISSAGGIKEQLVESALNQIGNAISGVMAKVGMEAGQIAGNPSQPPPAPEDAQDKYDMECKEFIEKYGAQIKEGDIRITEEGNHVVGKSKIIHDFLNTCNINSIPKPYITHDNFFILPPDYAHPFLIWLRDKYGSTQPSNAKTPI